MRVLRFSDLHLDASFASLGMTSSVASQRRIELRNAFRRILAKARELNVDAITIGGDLYEHERVTDNAARFLQKQFEELTPVPIFIAPGNHDPYVPGSVYHRTSWPSNVRIFDEPRFTPCEVGPDITLWGAGHDGPSVRDNLLSTFRPVGSGVHLILMHGSDVRSLPPGKAPHCPFTVDDLKAAAVNFALFGHYHTAIRPEPGRFYCYPGSPEPLGFGEEGDHYVLLLDVVEQTLVPDLVPIGQMRYHHEELDIGNVRSIDDIIDMIKTLSAQWASALIQVVLVGSPHPEVDVDLQALYAACAHCFRFLDLLDHTHPAYNVEELESEVTAKGRFVRKMQEKISRAEEDERLFLERALYFGLHALDGREVRLQ